jgi:WD40 repeat protein
MNLSHRKDRLNQVLFLKYTSDKKNILLGTTQGFQIYQIDKNGKPPLLIVKEEFDGLIETNNVLSRPGGVQSFDICEGSQLLALSSGGKYPKFPPTQIILYDLLQNEIVAEIEFNSQVRSVRICKNRLIIIFISRIIVYNLNPLEKLYEFEMYWNEHSVMDIQTDITDCRVIAFPARIKGQIEIAEILGGWSPVIQGSGDKQSAFQTRLQGHNSVIACLALSPSGNHLASASLNGTLIRIWHCKTGGLLNELRRGSDYADIYSMAFDPCTTKLAVISDKLTLHVFNLMKQESDSKNRNSILHSIPGIPKYFTSDWSFRSARVPSLKRSLIYFDPLSDGFDTLGILSCDGFFSCYNTATGKRLYLYKLK